MAYKHITPKDLQAILEAPEPAQPLDEQLSDIWNDIKDSMAVGKRAKEDAEAPYQSTALGQKIAQGLRQHKFQGVRSYLLKKFNGKIDPLRINKVVQMLSSLLAGGREPPPDFDQQCINQCTELERDAA